MKQLGLEHVLYPRRRATFAAPYLSVQQAAHAAHTLLSLVWTPGDVGLCKKTVKSRDFVTSCVVREIDGDISSSQLAGIRNSD